MKRVTTAAIVAAMLAPGAVNAQEAPEPDALQGPAVVEPESSSIDFVPTPKAPTPDQSPEAYAVQPGDTLWDLSQRFLGNPWYWPKVWSYNPEIENPHWIFPGNLIRFYPSADDLPAQVDADGLPPPIDIPDVSSGQFDAPGLVDGDGEDPVSVAPGLLRIGGYVPKKSVLRQDGLVTQRELDDAGIIDRAWAEKTMLSTYDRVYLRFRNRSAVRVGDQYSIFRTHGEVKHPSTGQRYGFLTHVVGTLRVVAVDQSIVTAEIQQTLEDIQRGDFVGPLGNFEKQVISKPNTRQINGVVLASMVPSLPMMGENHVVFVDKGSRDGVEEGNTFTVVRKGDPLMHVGEEERNAYPEEDVATIIVVDVKDNASAGLVVRSVREIVLGDRVIMVPNATRASAR